MATLVIVRGAAPGRRRLKTGHTVFGRDPTCDVVVPSLAVARQHAQITRRGDQYALQDLDSRGGTYLNHRPIHGLAPLRDGDTIGICDFRATFVQPLPELTETGWVASSDPQALLTCLRRRGMAPEDLRRVTAACHRRVGQVSPAYAAGPTVEDVESESHPGEMVLTWEGAAEEAREAVETASARIGWPEAGPNLYPLGRRPEEELWVAFDAASAELCRHIRDVVGNPFRPRPTVHPSVLAWNDRLVVRLARAIHEERRWRDVPLLGDALLDAGCDNEDMLSHAHEQDAVHTRDCWLIDLLLNKE